MKRHPLTGWWPFCAKLWKNLFGLIAITRFRSLTWRPFNVLTAQRRWLEASHSVYLGGPYRRWAKNSEALRSTEKGLKARGTQGTRGTLVRSIKASCCPQVPGILQQKVVIKLQDWRVTDAIYLDLYKAFDIVPHHSPVSKLERQNLAEESHSE